MAGQSNLTEFDATIVAQEFFNGSKPPEQFKRGWHAGDYKITSPNSVWVVEADELYARQEERLSRFVGGVAYSLAISGEVVPHTVTPRNVAEVCEELERIICINLHSEGTVAGAAEYERVQASRRAYTERQIRIESGEEIQLLSIFDHYPINYQKSSFV